MSRTILMCQCCGMAYDGDRYDRCPHCAAPITQETTRYIRDHVEIKKLIEAGDLTEDVAKTVILSTECVSEPYASNELYWQPYDHITYEDYVSGNATGWFDPERNEWRYKRIRPSSRARLSGRDIDQVCLDELEGTCAGE